MNSSTKFYNSAPVLSLLLARIFYSANWFNVASIFYLIATDFKQDISTLGLVTSSFILGVGLFQVPAGILAAKYSANRVAVFGILLASSCVFLTGLSDSIVQIAVLRFIVGVGMACFFGPSVVLISEYLGKRSEGLGIGLINSAHAIGGILGIFAWVGTSTAYRLEDKPCQRRSTGFGHRANTDHITITKKIQVEITGRGCSWTTRISSR